MKKPFLALAPAALALVFVGCSNLTTKTVRIESDPPGARVFMATAANATSPALGKDYLGTTPLEWTTQMYRNGIFYLPKAPIYRFVPRVIIFTAEPPSGQTNLVSAIQIFHGRAFGVEPDKVPSGIFFNLHPKK